MGLAASQARFLGLTARKTNVEYQGQQINQARTALSNEVMGLYDKYSRLEVPTPPSVNDYTKTVYQVDNTYNDYRIDTFTRINEGEYEGYYNVSLMCDEKIATPRTITQKDSVIEMRKNGDNYSYLSFAFGTDNFVFDRTNPELSTITEITGDYEKYPGLPTIMGENTTGTYYMYSKNGINYYTSKDDLDCTDFEVVDGKNMYYGDYAFDYQGEYTDQKTVNAIAAITQESNGRLSTIQILSCEDDLDLVGNTYSITTTKEDDQLAYQDAMNQYNYDKMVYEREVEKINKKTKEIQEQDRSLELQLNQLDTEQKALSTEMESISKVIEETIDSVFKTFSG
ncbi:MAG: hypothetical protein IJD57_02690 [Candidatus Gastranaerophilales bacterium]|nr:hypothetical protein [Candidatus Gastranaerophilales bacterium]